MNRHSTPSPPANSLDVLAADLLAQAARNLLEQVAFGTWEPGIKLRDALQTYSEVRAGNAIKDAADPQSMTVEDWDEPAPTTRPSEVR